MGSFDSDDSFPALKCGAAAEEEAEAAACPCVEEVVEEEEVHAVEEIRGSTAARGTPPV